MILNLFVASRRMLPLLALPCLVAACDAELPEGCDEPSHVELGDGDVFLWIAADYDAVLRCSDSNQCAEGDTNYGLDGYLAASNETVDRKASYLHFPVPELPPGTEIVEAYVELYHGGVMEDGKPDEQCLPVAPAVAPWEYDTITWNNQPNTMFLSPGGAFRIAVETDAWSGTGNIAGHVQSLVTGALPNDGFAFFAPQPGAPFIDKGFDSNNTFTRKTDDLGLAPRLLVRARLPETAERRIEMPELDERNDLPFNGDTIVIGYAEAGADWPESWEATASDPVFHCPM